MRKTASQISLGRGQFLPADVPVMHSAHHILHYLERLPGLIGACLQANDKGAGNRQRHKIGINAIN